VFHVLGLPFGRQAMWIYIVGQLRETKTAERIMIGWRQADRLHNMLQMSMDGFFTTKLELKNGTSPMHK